MGYLQENSPINMINWHTLTLIEIKGILIIINVFYFWYAHPYIVAYARGNLVQKANNRTLVANQLCL
jgi:hypothetical protein